MTTPFVSLDVISSLTDVEHAEVAELGRAVYPPAEWANWPGRMLEWTPAEWCVRVWRTDGGECAVTENLGATQWHSEPIPSGVGGMAERSAAMLRRDSRLVSYAGIVLRHALHDGAPVLIGGIGSVKTHPEARGRGYASLAIRRAVEFFRDRPDMSFGLLVCDPPLIAYYARLGWKLFNGRLMVVQHGSIEEFTFDRVMTLDLHTPAPTTGTIDLHGPPW